MCEGQHDMVPAPGTEPAERWPPVVLMVFVGIMLVCIAMYIFYIPLLRNTIPAYVTDSCYNRGPPFCITPTPVFSGCYLPSLGGCGFSSLQDSFWYNAKC